MTFSPLSASVDLPALEHEVLARWRELDVFGAVEIDAGVTVVGAGGHRKPRVETNNRQSGRHGATDYP